MPSRPLQPQPQPQPQPQSQPQSQSQPQPQPQADGEVRRAPSPSPSPSTAQPSPSSPPEPPPLRLFTALWPDAAVRSQLAACRDAWHWPAGARRVADAQLHATLHYIGAFACERLPELQARLAAVATRTPTLRAADTAVWRGGIAVLRLTGDAALAALHEELGAALVEFGIALDRRPFAPHVTLARRAAGAEPPARLPDFAWRATGFALVESRPGPPPAYAVFAAWP